MYGQIAPLDHIGFAGCEELYCLREATHVLIFELEGGDENCKYLCEFCARDYFVG